MTGSSEVSSAAQFWEDMVRGSAPVLMMKNSMPEQVWRERSQLAIRHVETSAGPFPAHLSATALLGVGIR